MVSALLNPHQQRDVYITYLHHGWVRLSVKTKLLFILSFITCHQAQGWHKNNKPNIFMAVVYGSIETRDVAFIHTFIVHHITWKRCLLNVMGCDKKDTPYKQPGYIRVYCYKLICQRKMAILEIYALKTS